MWFRRRRDWSQGGCEYGGSSDTLLADTNITAPPQAKHLPTTAPYTTPIPTQISFLRLTTCRRSDEVISCRSLFLWAVRGRNWQPKGRTSKIAGGKDRTLGRPLLEQPNALET